MRVHILQHVPFEDAGSMAKDFERRGATLTTTHWYRGDHAPELASFDALIVMGGPMGVYDETEFPWLVTEKSLIAAAIAADKIVVGVCLGAQLIACVLGARVYPNPQREIGWFPLTLNTPAEQSPLGNALAADIDVFHWHGDTFELPTGAHWLASSEACAHQAFSVGDKVFGFQFHLETTEHSARALIAECGNELDDSPFVQRAKDMLANPERFTTINRMMSAVLQHIFSR